MEWDSEISFAGNVVWWAQLDERYQVEVIRATAYGGWLRVFDHKDANRLLHSEPVEFSYQAIFGPDTADVALWQEMALNSFTLLKSCAERPGEEV